MATAQEVPVKTARRTGTRRATNRRASGRTIVHITAEYYPFARTGGLAEAVAGLATYQARAGEQVA